MAEPIRTLAADVYDALELSAHAYGGVGAHTYSRPEGATQELAPCCIFGHAYHVGNGDSSVSRTLWDAGITTLSSDYAVVCLTGARGGTLKRVAFKRWAKQLNVVRGT